jgi:hypothetical protein
MLALMSAENPQEVSDDGIYEFSMPQPIPSYLMSLAVGDIAFAAVGERTGVYAEPGVLTKARAEFSEMDEMLLIAEDFVWSLPVGAIRPDRFTTEFSLWRNGKSKDYFCHTHHFGGRQVTNFTCRTRIGAFLVGQPGDQCHMERFLAQRRFYGIF